MERFDGLGETGLEAAFECLLANCVAGEGGYGHGGNARELTGFLDLANLAKEGETVDDGKTEVADDDIGTLAIECVARGRSGIDGVDDGPGFDEDGGERAPGGGGVFDEQDVTAGEQTLEVRLLFGRSDAGVGILGCGGKTDAECGAGADAAAFGVNGATVKFGDLARDGEAETHAAFGADAGVFDLDETLEDLLEVLASDADAGVAHDELESAGGLARQLDLDASAGGSEFDGVLDQMTDELGETTRVGVERAGVGRKAVDEIDFF